LGDYNNKITISTTLLTLRTSSDLIPTRASKPTALFFMGNERERTDGFQVERRMVRKARGVVRRERTMYIAPKDSTRIVSEETLAEMLKEVKKQ
jgi:hypothetical protein